GPAGDLVGATALGQTGPDEVGQLLEDAGVGSGQSGFGSPQVEQGIALLDVDVAALADHVGQLAPAVEREGLVAAEERPGDRHLAAGSLDVVDGGDDLIGDVVAGQALARRGRVAGQPKLVDG